MKPGDVPAARLRDLNQQPVRPGGEFVLYWMIANRRTHWNYSLDRAIEWCRELGKPLVILEALRCDYPWASDRLHAFFIQGMIDNQRSLKGKPVTWYPWLEREPDAGRGLLEALASRACVVVTDDFPCTFLPRMTAAAAERVAVPVEAVDSNGIMPIRATDRVFARAVDFRRYLQRNVVEWLERRPRRDPLKNLALPTLDRLPAAIVQRWEPAALPAPDAVAERVRQFPVDHSVRPVIEIGGQRAARRRLRAFVSAERLGRYANDRNQPSSDAFSGLSAWLHFGHISAHEVFDAVTRYKPWSPERVADGGNGSRQGWWGAAPEVEAFLDELITWRELGFNRCALTDDYDRYESLPGWARETLEDHAADPREHVYTREEFDLARTHDDLWNAAQNQLVQEGRIHNYLRMLWGKKILHWSRSPEEAAAVMIELNNRYALDGRDPNSYSGVFWVLGRYDRAWGPERPVFGKVRYMSSRNTARKLRVAEYLEKYALGITGSTCRLRS